MAFYQNSSISVAYSIAKMLRHYVHATRSISYTQNKKSFRRNERKSMIFPFLFPTCTLITLLNIIAAISTAEVVMFKGIYRGRNV